MHFDARPRGIAGRGAGKGGPEYHPPHPAAFAAIARMWATRSWIWL